MGYGLSMMSQGSFSSALTWVLLLAFLFLGIAYFLRELTRKK